MPNVNIIPTEYKKGASGEVCTLVFPDPNDCGKYGLDDIHVINVWNGLYHFPGTKDRVHNFRDGVDIVFQKLMECSSICSNLKICDVSSTIAKGIEVIKMLVTVLTNFSCHLRNQTPPSTLRRRKGKARARGNQNRCAVKVHCTSLCLWCPVCIRG